MDQHIPAAGLTAGLTAGPTVTPASRLAQRYGEAGPLPVPAEEAWTPVIDTMLRHRSVRAYKPDAIPAGTIETLVATAQSAPTSSNMQTWSVIAVQDQARRERLAGFAANQKHIAQAPLFMVWLADLSRADRLGERAGHTMEALPFLETFLVAVIDAAMAAQNAMVAAESLGLGTVYIGAIRNHPEAVAAELALPPGVMATFGLCVGYEDGAASVKPRLPQPVVLHHEQYAIAPEASGIAAYDEALLAFQNEQAMKPQGWTDLVLNRLGAIKGLAGRDRLKTALQAMGFPLQ